MSGLTAGASGDGHGGHRSRQVARRRRSHGAHNGCVDTALLVRALDVESAAACLVSPEMIVAFAQLVDEEAAQETDVDRRAALKARAIALASVAARQYPNDEDLARAVREIESSDAVAGPDM